MLISEALSLAKDSFKKHQISSYSIDSLLLLCYCLSCSKEHIIFNSSHVQNPTPNVLSRITLTQKQEREFLALIKRRCNREPISHLIGKREFFGNDFMVNRNVLDPRADSETLIEMVLEYFVDKNIRLNILELGIGSGCLLCIILQKLFNSQGIGVDISRDALDVAQKNARSLGLSNRIELLQSNWFSNLSTINSNPSLKSSIIPNETHKIKSICSTSFDLIISNPPYIKSGDIKFLQEEIKLFEPIKALDGGKSGLDCYLAISQNIKNYLKKDAILILEIGQNQESEIIKIFTNNGLRFIKDKKDLSGIIRCLMFQN